ncbi:MAG: Gfo/Idh/MocA family protein [Cyanobacteriota bacterium]
MAKVPFRSSRPLRVAIAGLGFGEAVHLKALTSQSATEPVALWHPRQERLDRACLASGLPGTTDFSALLADPAVEAIVIATPPGPRFELARAALEAGKHLMLEKPVALEPAQVEELQRLALRARLTVAVDFEYRAVPLFQQAAEWIQQGRLGPLHLVTLNWLMGSRANPERPWNWYSQRSEGGGVLGSLGTHAFDTLHWLVGPTLRLQAQLSTVIADRPLADGSGHRAPVDADDVALVQLELETAAGASVPAQMTLSSVASRGRGYWIELYGREGTLVLGSSNQADYVHGFQLWISQGGEPLRPVPADPRLAFARTWEDGRIAPVERLHGWWAEAIRSGRPMVPGLAEALASERCCADARGLHGIL